MRSKITTAKPNEHIATDTSSRHDQIALKYLDIARAEILDRMKLSNQTLVFYVGGVGAVAGWMYQATLSTPGKSAVDLKLLVFPIGAIVAFLALATSWILYHNERMVNALASYQKNVLAKYLNAVSNGLIAWEASEELHSTDSTLTTIATTIIVQAILIIGPSVVFLGGMLDVNGYRPWPVRNLTSLQKGCYFTTLPLNFFAIYWTARMILERKALRDQDRPAQLPHPKK